MRIIGIIVLITLIGCNGCKNSKQSETPMDPNKMAADLVAMNKAKHEAEIVEINEFVKNKGWNVTTTGTGLRYWIYEEGNGAQAKTDDIVSIAYKVQQFDGKLLYEATKEKPGSFKVGQDNVESGLHEMLLLMKVGDKAKVILPSYLAFGFTGDSNKVSHDMPLVYDLELVSIQ